MGDARFAVPALDTAALFRSPHTVHPRLPSSMFRIGALSLVGWIGVAAWSLLYSGCRTGGASVAGSAAPSLIWDTTERVLDPKPGESSVAFQFTATNVSGYPVTITGIRPACDCAIAALPETPWVLAPGGSGTFVGTFDLKGYHGTVSKAVHVTSDRGKQTLTITVKVPGPDEALRKQHQAIARADRQAVFGGDCAKCHVQPAMGASGGALFTAGCGVCHLSRHRAVFVPDLLTARQRRDTQYWRTWISNGKPDTMMPAWAGEQGGPLTKDQIESLIQFALEKLPTEPRTDR